MLSTMLSFQSKANKTRVYARDEKSQPATTEASAREGTGEENFKLEGC